ncbi:energy transducer TonB [bacterium]|nr:energy transducer TonB [bacterium]
MADRDFGRNGTRKGGKLILFILLSVLFHGLIFLIKIDISGESSDEESLVSIKYLDDSPAKLPASPVLPPKPERKKEDLKPKGQIVDIAKPKIEKKPQKSRFLSEYDSSVEKETVAAEHDENISVRGEKLKRQLAKKAENVDSESDESMMMPVQSADMRKPEPSKAEKIKKGELQGFDGLDGNYAAGKEKEIAGKLDARDDKDEEGRVNVGGRWIPKKLLPYLNGTDAVLMSPSNDFLEDVKKGNETYLNTQKFAYAAYFNKIKQAISRNWSPGTAIIVNDPTGRMYGRKDRFTKLQVFISAQGKLVKAKVITSCGVDFLDREAINAFKMAAPFAPPPEILLNKDKQLEIRFGFMVTTHE